MAGVVTILVEALSMGSGQYLSAKSASQYVKNHNMRVPIISGFIMAIGYILGGLVPLIPIIFLPVDISRIAAIVGALIGLFILGYVKGKIVKMSPIRSAMEIVIIGGIASREDRKRSRCGVSLVTCSDSWNSVRPKASRNKTSSGVYDWR